MKTHRHHSKAARAARTGASLALLALGSIPLFSPATTQAADPYDKSLEARVEALERELNAMSNDSKGKNVSTNEVPTFVRASKNVQELVFSGELRLRHEYGVADSQVNDSTAQEDRNRFRFRLFADYKLDNQFFAGAAAQTSLAADSGNTTVSEGFDNYSLYLWRFFIGWKSKDDSVKIIAGKQPNPFYEETEMLWDADVSPFGVTEQLKYKLGSQLELSLLAGQFYFYDNAENAFDNGNNTAANPTVPGGLSNEDAYLLYQQVLATYKLNNQFSISAAPGYFFYAETGGTNSATALNPSAGNAGQPAGAGNGQGQAANALQNGAAFNSANATRNFAIGTLNTDVKIDLGKFKVKLYGQAAYNFVGGKRIAQEYATPVVPGTASLAGYQTARGLDGIQDKLAFSTGVTFGSDYQIKKKGDYVFLAEYRQVGLGSVDPNLNDSDWNFSRLGFRGIKGAVSYGFYPWLIGSFTYFGANNIGSEKNLNIPVGNYNASHVFQFDLTAKF